jgi:hypothetical protein
VGSDPRAPFQEIHQSSWEIIMTAAAQTHADENVMRRLTSTNKWTEVDEKDP